MLKRTCAPRSKNAPSSGFAHLPAWGLVTALAALGATPLAAENPTREFVRCIEEQDDTARLACYDRLANQVVELGLPGTWRETANAATPGGTGAASASAAANAGSAGTAAPTTSSAARTPAPTAAEDQFGKPQATPDDEIEAISARVIGGFVGWTGNTVFELDNGQVWEQAGSGRFNYSGHDRRVEIRRALFNTFTLSAEGLNRSVRVRRIE